MRLENTILTDSNGTRWRVREAKSEAAARAAIDFARVTGSVGSRTTRDNLNKHLEVESSEVVADVVQLNDDGTERQPS